ncbi:hypothetical protein AAFF_G00101000 [Aldrovandia affinis]|uniref:Uncharacterized protein n=1 Tax=Aldrovandia affinis TaxID=143900 RepID=A0AAD7WBQ0_9TELE|nr:hypothetical protein AAFF_G00101000 [Aldrovandia affinis]
MGGSVPSTGEKETAPGHHVCAVTSSLNREGRREGGLIAVATERMTTQIAEVWCHGQALGPLTNQAMGQMPLGRSPAGELLKGEATAHLVCTGQIKKNPGV